MLTDHVCFLYQALMFLTESLKNHVLNTMNQTVVTFNNIGRLNVIHANIYRRPRGRVVKDANV